MTARLIGWLVVALALLAAGGWAGYGAGHASRDGEVARLVRASDTAAAERDTARGQVAAQYAATQTLADAADAHAKKLAADAAAARQAARQASNAIDEVLRNVPPPPAATAAACQPVEDLLRGYARAARDARRVPSVPADPASPAAPASPGAVRGAGAGPAGDDDGTAAG